MDPKQREHLLNTPGTKIAADPEEAAEAINKFYAGVLALAAESGIHGLFIGVASYYEGGMITNAAIGTCQSCAAFAAHAALQQALDMKRFHDVYAQLTLQHLKKDRPPTVTPGQA